MFGHVRIGDNARDRDLGGSPHDKVCDAWAKQSGYHKRGKRMMYEGEAIYSHGRHYMLAMLRPDLTLDGKPVCLVNHRVWLNHHGQDSPSTRRHREHAESSAKRAGFVCVPTLDPLARDHAGDVAGFCAEAEAELGDKDRSPSDRLWRASARLYLAKQTARLLLDRDRREARSLIAKGKRAMRATLLAIRARRIKSALPHALAYAFAILGEAGARCIECGYSQGDQSPIFETPSGMRFAMIKPWRSDWKACELRDLPDSESQ